MRVRVESEDQALTALTKILGSAQGKRVYRIGQSISEPVERLDWFRDILNGLANGDMSGLTDKIQFRERPVSVRKFIEDPYYLNKRGTVYPAIMSELEEINSGKYVETVFTGGIGSGKTTASHYTTAYQLYLLSCMRDPHDFFDLDPSSEILFVFQSMSASHAKNVEYNRFRSMMEGSHYFREEFPYDKYIESKLIFPNRIEAVPLSGEESAAIGQNVMGGVLDEVNYMSVVEESKNSADGGTYDQAWALYNSIARRRKSRFIKNGKVYGMLCLVSSKRYPGQFTDIKEQQAKKQVAERGETEVYIYDKRSWEIHPEGTYSGESFPVFIGDDFRKPKVLEPEETVAEGDGHLVMHIPVEHRDEFDHDIINALREVAGVSTLAAHPYILDTEAVGDCMQSGQESVFTREWTDFTDYNVAITPSRIVEPDKPRWAHLDLSISGDSTGLVIGHVAEFVQMDRGDNVEMWPRIALDAVLEVRPPKNGEIEYHRIRSALYKLNEMGMNIQWVSFDSFQSVDSMQVLRQQGLTTGLKSVDTDMRPYALTKAAIYDRRIEMPPHDKLRKELLSVEYDPKKNKVDHPANSSKDVADALAGVVFGLTTRTGIWLEHGIPPTNIPQSVKDSAPLGGKKQDDQEPASSSAAL